MVDEINRMVVTAAGYQNAEFAMANPFVVTASVLVVCAYFACREWYRRLMEKKAFLDLPMPPTDSLMGHLKLFSNRFKDQAGVQNGSPPSFLQYTNEYGQVGLWIFRPSILVSHYEDALTILAAESYRDPPDILARHVRKFLGNNIGILNGRDWRLHRGAILRSLNPASTLETARRSMIDVAQTFTESLTKKVLSCQRHGDGGEFTTLSPPLILEVESLMNMITIDVFARTNLSVDLGCCRTLEASPVAKAFDYLLYSFGKRMSSPLNPFNYCYSIPTARNLRHEKERRVIRSFLHNLIQDRKLLQTKVGIDGQDVQKHDVLSNLLQANADAKKVGIVNKNDAFDFDGSLEDTVMALLFAGYETTSITLTYVLYCVAKNPEIEKKCLEEIWAICGRSNGDERNDSTDHESSLAEDLNPRRLAYCRGVVLECLRIYPPADFTTRLSKKPIKLRGGFVIPAGCSIFIPIEIIQRSDRHFERPMEFIPERWVQRVTRPTNDVVGDSGDTIFLELWEERPDMNVNASQPSCADRDHDQYDHDVQNNAATRASSSDACVDHNVIAPANRAAFLAFSSGARSCPGSKFAMQEAVIVFAILLRRFKFEVLPDYVLKSSQNGLVSHPSDGIPMIITLRD
jgi:cytochrome P450